MQPVSQAFVQCVGSFEHVVRDLESQVFVDVGGAGSKDDFVCEGDFEGRDACAGLVARDAGSGIGAEQKSDVLLGKR